MAAAVSGTVKGWASGPIGLRCRRRSDSGGRARHRHAPLGPGFGFLLPGEIRMYLEMTSAHPDDLIIAAIGRQNAMLGGVQGLFQFLLILVMAHLRFGGF